MLKHRSDAYKFESLKFQNATSVYGKCKYILEILKQFYNNWEDVGMAQKAHKQEKMLAVHESYNQGVTTYPYI